MFSCLNKRLSPATVMSNYNEVKMSAQKAPENENDIKNLIFTA